MSNWFPSFLFFYFFFISSSSNHFALADSSDDTLRTFSIGGGFSVQYLAQIAAFGNPLDGSDGGPTNARTFNLMLPPDNPWLCEFPEAYLPLVGNGTASNSGTTNSDATTNTNPWQSGTGGHQHPVALFISINRCSAEQKARVAQEIQRRVSGRLRLLVVYSPDPRAISLLRLQPDDRKAPDTIGNDIAIVHVPYRYAAGIDTRMRMAWTGRDPRFLIEDNEYWSFPITLSNYTREDDDGFLSGGDDDGGPEIFPWFRIILFTILVCSPCCRACYLWYSSGGRFYLRRNEQGRIIGIQYVPPAPTWLNRGEGADMPPRPRQRDVLTQEQFEQLPEIEYKLMQSHYDEDNEGQEQEANGQEKEEEEEKDIQVAPASVEEDADNNSNNANNNNNDEENAEKKPDESNDEDNAKEAAENNAEPDDVEAAPFREEEDGPPTETESETTKASNVQEAPFQETDESPEEETAEQPTNVVDSNTKEEEAPFNETDDAPGPTTGQTLAVAYGAEGEEDQANNNNKDDEDDKEVATDAETNKASPANNATDETDLEAGPPDTENELNDNDDPMACRSTMCSICIDEFEPGEKVILLPRCRHAFHNECLHPWLTERQGCCPFCKTPVLEEASDTEGDEEEEEESQPNNTENATAGQNGDSQPENDNATQDVEAQSNNNNNDDNDDNQTPEPASQQGANVNFNSLQFVGADASANTATSEEPPTRAQQEGEDSR